MNKFLIIYVSLLMSMISCSPVRLVSTENNSRKDFSQYKTFAFGEVEKRVTVKRANSEAIEEYVRQAVVKSMIERGYQITDQNPDLLLDLDLSLLDYQTDQRSQTQFVGRRNYYYNYNYGYEPIGNLQTDPNMEASISIVFADASEKQKLSEGIVEAQLAKKSQKSIDRLNDAVETILSSLLGE